MTGKVSKEEPIKVLHGSLAVGPTTAGYTLGYAVEKDGPYTAYSEATPASETCLVVGIPTYVWVKLIGNVDDDVVVIL